MADALIQARKRTRKEFLTALRSKLRETRSSTPLSTLFSDPLVQDAFERGERDNGAAFAVPAPKAPVLGGGEARVLEAV